ncbi:MAG: cytochrome c3 family protein [Tepidisphaeraceae bacterium]
MPFLFLCLSALPAPAQVNSGKDCAICHLDWVDSFRKPAAILLMDKPEKSQAAEPDMCLGCHDGSVADSRRLVWKEHSHRTGVTPSAGMTVPKDLPLEDGKLTCRTCHSAHNAGMTGSLKEAFFLRTGNETGQLCKSCHQDKAKGPAAGSHPLVRVPGPASTRISSSARPATAPTAAGKTICCSWPMTPASSARPATSRCGRQCGIQIPHTPTPRAR